MKLIIPMSGQGSRFIAVGYTDPKPLIMVEGKPIIAHVLDMFPGIDEVIFVCNEDHLNATNMREVLTSLRPQAQIIGIGSKKLGPVHALTYAFPYLTDEEDVIVSYCDFTQDWDFADFCKKAATKTFAGAVPSYTGFHPHLLRRNLYAGVLTDQTNMMTTIQEKHCFTALPEDSHHSSGIYYFASGTLLKKYSAEMIADENTLNGEYYVSMLYPYLLRDSLPVYVPPITHFRQWGTPEDLEEYEAWSRLIHHDLGLTKTHTDIPPSREQFVTIPYLPDTVEYKNSYAYWQATLIPKNKTMINIIPMAGLGSRFAQEGYLLPKALVPVSGKPMIVQVINHLPHADTSVFIVRQEHITDYKIDETIKAANDQTKIIALSETTEGQATTCLLGLEGVDDEEEVFISACDNAFVFNEEQFEALKKRPDVDCIVWTFTKDELLTAKPTAWGWIKLADDGETIADMSVKVPVSDDPFNDHAVVATFWFRRAGDYKAAYAKMVEENHRVNNEFYVDSMPVFMNKLGKKSIIFPVDLYVGWGKPADLHLYDLREFQYTAKVGEGYENETWRRYFSNLKK